MRVKVLGSAAGGGVPQWNCNYRYSRMARSGSDRVIPRLQSSIAVSADKGWVIFNASPDIRQQIAQTEELQPAAEGPPRSTPIAAVVLTNADIDHIAGLLSLRERQPFHLYATRRVLEVLEANSVFRVLDPCIVRRIELETAGETAIGGPKGDTGLRVQLYPVSGKVALFLESGDKTRDFDADGGDTVGVRITEEGRDDSLHYVPGCAGIDDHLLSQVAGSTALLFDGTVFNDNEMADAGVGDKTGKRMGHLAIGGPDGSLAAFAKTPLGRRIYIHINNTNPILDRDSPQRDAVERAGWEVAFDGMEIAL
jgi:pyrroloquinoline quinone biosynthesis protein B